MSVDTIALPRDQHPTPAQPEPKLPECRRCWGRRQVSDMMTASIRTDTLPPTIPCPECC